MTGVCLYCGNDVAGDVCWICNDYKGIVERPTKDTILMDEHKVEYHCGVVLKGKEFEDYLAQKAIDDKVDREIDKRRKV